MSTTTELISAAGTIITGVLAWRAAKSASEAAHQSAEVAANSEQHRRWMALEPRFVCVAVANEKARRAELRIRLDGPNALERLDRVTVTIRDDRPDRGRQILAGAATGEQIVNQIWGPYRLNPNIENTDGHGRHVVHPDGVTVGEDIVCALEKTFPPGWASSGGVNWWESEYYGKPVRLLIECEREGYEVWRIPVEVEVLRENEQG